MLPYSSITFYFSKILFSDAFFHVLKILLHSLNMPRWFTVEYEINLNGGELRRRRVLAEDARIANTLMNNLNTA